MDLTLRNIKKNNDSLKEIKSIRQISMEKKSKNNLNFLLGNHKKNSNSLGKIKEKDKNSSIINKIRNLSGYTKLEEKNKNFYYSDRNEFLSFTEFFKLLKIKNQLKNSSRNFDQKNNFNMKLLKIDNLEQENKFNAIKSRNSIINSMSPISKKSAQRNSKIILGSFFQNEFINIEDILFDESTANKKVPFKGNQQFYTMKEANKYLAHLMGNPIKRTSKLINPIKTETKKNIYRSGLYLNMLILYLFNILFYKILKILFKIFLYFD